MSDKVKLAIVGCGGMAGAHADHIRNVPDVEVVAVFRWRTYCMMLVVGLRR